MAYNRRNAQLTSLLKTDFVASRNPAYSLGQAASTYRMIANLRGMWTTSSVNDILAIADMSGQGRALTQSNTPTFGVFNLAPYVSYVRASSQAHFRADEAALDVTAHLTLGCWIRFNALPSSYPANVNFFGKWTSGANRAYMLYATSANVFTFDVSLGTGAATTVNIGSALVANTWYFVVGRYTPSTELAIWVDRTKVVNTTAIPASLNNSTASLVVNGVAGSYGDIDVSMLFLSAAALSDAFIFALYESTRHLYR